MIITLIAAMAHDRVIGHNKRLPWHLPADLAHFKSLTWGKPILMGRTTFETIGKPLPGRQNIILTHKLDYQASDCLVVNSIDAALAAATDSPELMIIGGANVYEQFLPHAQRMHLTLIDAAIAGDTYFPEWDHKEWQEISRIEHAADEKNKYAYWFLTLERKAQ
jgi:dihydrofolate reductase